MRTNSSGFLQGIGQLQVDDQIVALHQVDEKHRACDETSEEDCIGKRVYRVYHTSAEPSERGLYEQLVDDRGVQKLVVSADNPLVLFDLDISLEWDARNDGTFMEDLEQAILRSSEVLYDVTNGQMALGDVTIHQAKVGWETADAVIFAANNVHPRASMGGIVDRPTADEILISDPRIRPSKPKNMILKEPFCRDRFAWGRCGIPSARDKRNSMMIGGTPSPTNLVTISFICLTTTWASVMACLHQKIALAAL